MSLWILIKGDSLYGFDIAGPFLSREAAKEFQDQLSPEESGQLAEIVKEEAK